MAKNLNWKRGDVLKSLGLITVRVPLTTSVAAEDSRRNGTVEKVGR